MKKLLAALLAGTVCLSASACQNEKINEEKNTMDYEVKAEYSLKEYVTPLWDSNIIVNETAMFAEWDEKDFMTEITDTSTEALFEDTVYVKDLLFPAEEIYAVYSYDLKKEYVKGKDWDILNGKLVRYKDSEIPIMTEEIYYPQKPQDGHAFNSAVEGHEKILFGEGDTMTNWQIAVTYKHSGNWDAALPTVQSEKIKNFIKKLENGEEATILFYGDSITTGANSSDAMNISPHAPSFAQMVTDFIAEKYGYSVSKEADPFNKNLTSEPLSGEKVIHYINTAVGGTTSSWGIEELNERVLTYEPDLMILGFGMNEGGSNMETFTASITELVGKVQTACPETEIVLVATMLPHYRVEGFYGNQYQHEDALKDMVKNSTELNTSKIAVAEVTSAHKYALEHKDYYDMTGNNVNHPNDFLARIYASVILRTMFGDYMK